MTAIHPNRPSPVVARTPPPQVETKPAPKAEAKPAPQNANAPKATPDTFEVQRPSQKAVAGKAPPPAKQSISGEDAAKEEVKLPTVKGMREGVEKSQDGLKTETKKQVDGLFAMADGKQLVPKDVEVKKLGNDKVELRRKDGSGNLSELTVATRGKDGELTVDSASFQDGVNTRDRMEVRKDGSTKVENAQWKGDKNETASLKSMDSIKDTRDANLSYSSEEARKEGDKLIHDTVQMKDGGVKGSSTTYEQQPDKNRKQWIDKKLHGPFDFKKDVDRTTTMSYSVPPPGKDGKQEPPTFSKVHHFSQDNVKATSYVDRILDGHAKFAGKGAHTVKDFEKVRDEYKKGGGEKWDADKTSETAPPKRWTVDLKTDENTLKNQTFVEGYPDATVSTTKTRKGNEVKETYEGKAFNPNSGNKDASKLYDVKGETTKVFDPKNGFLAKMDSKITEPDGAQVEQHLEAKARETERGLETHQTLTGKRTKDGKSESTELKETWLKSNEGEQLLNASGKVVDAAGREAIHEIGENGEKMRIKPPGQKERDVTDPENLAGVEKELMATAAATNADRVGSALSNGGGKALELLKGVKENRASRPNPQQPGKPNTPQPGNPNTTQPGTTNTTQPGKPTTTTPGTTTTPPATTTPPGQQGGTTRAGSPMPLADKVFGAKGLDKLKTYSGPGLMGAGGVVGVVAGAMNVAQGVRQGNDHAIAKGVMDMASGAASVGEGGAQFYQSIKNIKPPDLKGMSVPQQVKTNLLKGAGKFGTAGAVFGVVGGALDIAEGAKGKDGAQIAKGAVNIAGAVGGLAASAAGGPIGLAIGGAIALGTFIFGKIMDAVSDKAHKIAELTIDDK